MGFYYGPSKPPDDEKEPGGCMEALILTRAAFGALAVPLAILFGSVIGLVGVFYFFSIHPLLGLLALWGSRLVWRCTRGGSGDAFAPDRRCNALRHHFVTQHDRFNRIPAVRY